MRVHAGAANVQLTLLQDGRPSIHVPFGALHETLDGADEASRKARLCAHRIPGVPDSLMGERTPARVDHMLWTVRGGPRHECRAAQAGPDRG